MLQKGIVAFLQHFIKVTKFEAHRLIFVIKYNFTNLIEWLKA